ncbi:MAG: hypothetical protein EB060_00290 [Proteobacteria bacterium]|nr:hypothetical protein [Pseudomonadota bacterium]
MLKQLATLIKLHKQTLDQMRRELAALQDGLTKVESAIIQHEVDIKEEQKLAASSLEASYMYGQYAKAAIKKRKKLQDSKKEMEGLIAIMRDKMAQEFAEQKKYEILKRKKEEEELKERERKQTIALDEMAAVKHQRKMQVQDKP